jgi:type IX secretion system PorP/SprF family membrane protein
MKVTTKLIAAAMALTALGNRVSAQDPRFSQYFASPMTLNPALTGSIEGPFRIAANFRQQWWAVGDPFNTASLSFEQRLLENRLGDNDRLGIGGLMMIDNSMSGGLRSTYMGVSAAFHKGLNERHRIGVGFQTVYGNRIVDYNKLSFYNQFDVDGFNTSLPSGEMALATMQPTVDFNAGLLYHYEDEKTRFYAGYSMYHITRPKQTVMEDANSRIPFRYTANAGATILSGENMRYTFHAIWQRQAKASDISAGGAVGLDLDEKNTFYLGAWYRVKDSFYPYFSYVRNGMQFGLTFDLLTSSLRQASPRNGSVELSFVFNKPSTQLLRRALPWNY